MKRSFLCLVFLIVTLVVTPFFVLEVEAQETKVFGNPNLPDWLNVTVTEYSDRIIVDNGDGFVWEFPKDKDKFNQIYENGTLIVKDEQWFLIGGEGKEDSHPIGELEWEQPKPYNVVVKDFYEDAKLGNVYQVVYDFYGGFHPKITFNASIGSSQNYTVDWRCWLYKDNALIEPEKHRVKFWDEDEIGVVFNYEDVYRRFGNIIEGDVTGWFKGKRFDQVFNVGFLSGPFLLDPSFGKTDVGGSSAYRDENLFGSKFTLSEAGDLTKISAYLKWGEANCKAGIYSDNVGVPNALLANSGEVAVSAEQWYDFTLSYSASAATYWLVIIDAGDSHYYYSAGSSNQFVYESVVYGAFPNPFPTPDGYQSRAMSIYANYTIAGGEEYERSASQALTVSLTASRTAELTKAVTQAIGLSIVGDRLIDVSKATSLAIGLGLDAIGELSGLFERAASIALTFTSNGERLIEVSKAVSQAITIGLEGVGAIIGEYNRAATLSLTFIHGVMGQFGITTGMGLAIIAFIFALFGIVIALAAKK